MNQESHGFNRVECQKSTIGNIKKYDTCKLRRNLRLMWKEHYGYEPPRVGKNVKNLDKTSPKNPIHPKFGNSITAKQQSRIVILKEKILCFIS